jgi:hypothetical protein
MWTGSSHRPPPPDWTASVSGKAQNDEEDMQWIVLDAATTDSQGGSTSSDAPGAVAALTPIDSSALSPQLDPDLFEDATAAMPNSDDSLDEGARALLYGRYVGQIDARVQRAWLRPRAPIGDTRFNCRARIAQDRTGNVREVTLEQCNGGERWRLSLVRAIESASPLPAPPDPRVFNRVIRLSFQSESYVPGGSAQELFEPPTPATAAEDAKYAARGALDVFNRTLKAARAGAIVNLKIVGSGAPADAPARSLPNPDTLGPQNHLEAPSAASDTEVTEENQ